MTKPASILKFSITIIATIIIIGIVGFFTLGFNNSLEFGNAYQAEISFLNLDEQDNIEDAVKTVLKENKINIRESKLEDRGFYHTLVVKFKLNDLKNVDEIKTQLVETVYHNDAPAEEKALITIQSIGPSVHKGFGWYVLLTIAVLAIIAFVFGWARKSIFAGLANMISIVASSLLSLSIILVSRVELSVSTVGVVLFSVLFVAIINTLIFSKLRDIKQSRSEQIDSYSLAVGEIIKSYKKLFIYSFAVIAAISVIFIITLNLDFIFVGLALLISALSSLTTTLLVGMPFFVLVSDNKINKQKALLSRNQDAKSKKK